jgi:23S rRNA pseudouridine1911/1915/1917 synthase
MGVPQKALPMQEWTVSAADSGMRLDLWLARRTEAGSRRRVAEWIARGKVFLDGQGIDSATAAHRLAAGERVGLWRDRPGSSAPPARSVVPLRRLLHVVHQDRTLVVVDKPPGLLVDPLPGEKGNEVTLLDLVQDHFSGGATARLYVVHRIDRDTSGLVLLARTAAACADLKAQFEAHTPERVYQAVVLGRPAPAAGTWRDRLAWDASSLRQRRAHGRDARAKEAMANYIVREQFSAAALVEVSLVTGKRNQIRVQAALRGHPLLGERQYRFQAPPAPVDLPAIPRHALHACRLGFIHPATGEQVCFTAALPADLEALVRTLRA